MRPIDADVLLPQMIHRRDYVGRASDAVCLVEDAPTIDAVPVQHGQWVVINPHVDSYDITGVYTWSVSAQCSCCGFIHRFIEGHMCYTYCPNCGAKMDEDKKDD